MRSTCHFYYWICTFDQNSVIKMAWWVHGGISKKNCRPLFIIIFRPEMLKFHPYSILTGDTMVWFFIYCVLIKYVLNNMILQFWSVIYWLIEEIPMFFLNGGVTRTQKISNVKFWKLSLKSFDHKIFKKWILFSVHAIGSRS